MTRWGRRVYIIGNKQRDKLKYTVKQRNGVIKNKAILGIERDAKWEFWRILDWVVKEGIHGDRTVSKDQTEMNRQTMCIAGMSVFQEGETVSAKVLR